MTYISRVQSNLKYGCDLRLGRLTLLVGPEGSGKSTVVQSLELATKGSASDVEGRASVKQASALARLFSVDETPHIMCSTDDGRFFSWCMNRKEDGSLAAPEHKPACPVAWPFAEVKERLLGDSTTVNTYVESLLPAGQTLDAVLEALAPDLRPIVKDLARKSRGKVDFIALAAEAKSKARELRTQATKSEKVVERMTQGVPAPLLPENEADLRERLNQLAEQRLGQTREARDNLLILASEVEEEVIETRKLLDLMPQPEAEQAELIARVRRMVALIEQNRELALSRCGVCGRNDETLVADIETRAQSLQKLLDTYGEQRQQRIEREQLTRRLAQLEAGQAKLVEKLKVPVVEDRTAEREQIMARLATHTASARTWTNASAARQELMQQRKQADHMTEAAKELSRIGKEQLDASVASLSSSIARFLPGDEVGVDVAIGRFGFVRNGQLHTATSGGEERRLFTAIAAATASDSAELVIIAPEDRAWDPRTLSNVMRSLVGCTAQVVLMSTVPPESSVDGWTMIEVG